MFQARHYVFLAAWLRELYDEEGVPDYRADPAPAAMPYVIRTLADKLAKDNPRFDAARFMKAATGE